MLFELPFEIIYHIALFLPTATSVAHLSQTCRRLHAIITAEDSRIFRAFVSTKFPQIETPPFWKDAAQALASRSRALDRHAVIGRFVLPPRNAAKIGSHRATRRDNPTLGYRPAIDSYEVWNGERWADRKEVLAWGAADELIIRIKQSGTNAREKWFVFSDLEQTSSYDDICGVCLLKSCYYSKDTSTEHLVFGRVRGEISLLAISPDKEVHEYKRQFETHGLELERIGLSDGPHPILAAHFANGTISFYHTTSENNPVQAFTHIRITSDRVTRNKCSRFLSPDKYALATGRFEDSLSIAAFRPEGLSLFRQFDVGSMDIDEHTGINKRANVTAVSPLNTSTSGMSTGNVFLAAWGDRAIRLHDLRSHNPFEATFRDSTNQNPVYNILPFGHDRFVVGAGGDAVVKIFDLRMPNTYNYLDAKGHSFIS
ncbi:F-box domain protein, partial [Aspergillus sclerotialis]